MSTAIVSAAAALAGVLIGQIASWLQRRAEERRRRRIEIAATVAPTLSLILEATEQIRRSARAQTAWRRQAGWGHLCDHTWPGVRTLLLTQAAQEAIGQEPSFYTVTVRLQELLASEEQDVDAALHAWDGAREQILALRDRELRPR